VDSTETIDQSGILFVCHECDALQRVPAVEPGHDAECVRCGLRLFRNPKGSIDKPLALIIASIILFLIANTYPIMTLTIAGVKLTGTITDTAWVFVQQGSPEIAAIVWLPSVLFPGLTIAGLFYVLFSIRFQMNWPHTRTILAWITHLLPWGMMDVFLLGILVALVKLVALADVLLGTGFYAFLILIFLYAATIASLEPHTLWESLNVRADEQGAFENG